MVKKKLENTGAQTHEGVTNSISPEALSRHLLGIILRSRGKLLEISPEIGEMAEVCLSYIDKLEELTEQNPDTAKHYRSILPLQQKKTVKWAQPKSREHPVYVFDITCPYCQRTLTIERLSPHTPAHCNQDSCKQEHTRTLARERKRRQRKNKK